MTVLGQEWSAQTPQARCPGGGRFGFQISDFEILSGSGFRASDFGENPCRWSDAEPFRLAFPGGDRNTPAMKSTPAFVRLGAALFLCATPLAMPAAAAARPEPFDYFRNSWNVIALKDYKDGTRVTPNNELLLGNNVKVRLACGPQLTPLNRQQTKTLLEGWLPIILLDCEQDGVRYDFTLWATPLPTVRDWRAAFEWPTEGENFLNWVQVKATNPGQAPAEARVHLDRLGSNAVTLAQWSQKLPPGRSAETCFRVPFLPVADASAWEKESPRKWLDRTAAYWRDLLDHGARIDVPCEKSTQTLRAAHVCQLIASDHGELHAGEGFYDEFYIRDGGYQLLELEEAGLWDAARKAIAPYLGRSGPTAGSRPRATSLTPTARRSGPSGSIGRSPATANGCEKSIRRCAVRPSGLRSPGGRLRRTLLSRVCCRLPWPMVSFFGTANTTLWVTICGTCAGCSAWPRRPVF